MVYFLSDADLNNFLFVDMYLNMMMMGNFYSYDQVTKQFLSASCGAAVNFIQFQMTAISQNLYQDKFLDRLFHTFFN